MRHAVIASFVLLCTLSATAGALETLTYDVLRTEGDIEIRRYEPHLLATVEVEGKFSKAGSLGFRPLFDYISGDNNEAEKIAMTAPVLQQANASADQSKSGQWFISFVVPSEFNQQNVPAPSGGGVRITAQPELVVAAIKYSGGWSQQNYEAHELLLLNGLNAMNLSACGTPRWARYDPPFMPWFLRKNEILIPICEPLVFR
jgi:hypothetical protein